MCKDMKEGFIFEHIPTNTHGHMNVCPLNLSVWGRGSVDALWSSNSKKLHSHTHTRIYVYIYIYIYIYKTETDKLQIIKISLNPKPHLETQRLPLVWVLPCQQCSMGNEEWVGVWPDDLSTTRLGPSINIFLHSAPAQSIALIFTYTEGSCKTCVNWGRWKGNCIADGCCVSWTLNSLLTFWACYQF